MVAELSTMFRFAGGLQINGGIVSLQAELTHPGATHHLAELVRQVYSIEPDVVAISKPMRQGNSYLLRVVNDGERIARRAGILDVRGRPVRGLAPQIVGGTKADAAAAWRGAF